MKETCPKSYPNHQVTTRGMEGEGSNPGVAMDSANPLLRAVFLRRLRLTRLLLEGGAYVNESDSQGQTPLMVACRTQHTDAQSASRVKLVQFLLEKGADPNIQDKEGHSALMHACQEQAGPEVVSLLLASGADISLEDQSGTSALVYAVMAGDWTVLKLLLDTCKAKGKEVIIIATDKFPQGKLEAQRYLSIPPTLGPLEQTDKMASAAPASPSEIQLITSPQCTSSSSSSSCPPKPIFSFKEVKSCGVSSHPCSPSRLRGLSKEAANRLQQPLLRLNSEPWLKIPTSQLSQQQQQQPHAASPSKNDSNHPEEFSVSVPIMKGDNSWQSNSCKWYEGRLARENGVEGPDRKNCTKHGRQKISLPSLLSPHSASNPNLHSVNLGTDSPGSGAKLHSTSLHSMASSSLHSIIQRRKLGADIYNSDPQLTVDIPNPPTDGKRLASLHRSSTLCSRESSLVLGPSSRVLSRYERRGSGAFLLDHNSQAKPRSLPPLTLSSTNTPNLNVYNFGPGAVGSFSEDKFLPSAPPGHPTELTRKMLLRRHSMQTEQFKTTV